MMLNDLLYGSREESVSLKEQVFNSPFPTSFSRLSHILPTLIQGNKAFKKYFRKHEARVILFPAPTPRARIPATASRAPSLQAADPRGADSKLLLRHTACNLGRVMAPTSVQSASDYYDKIHAV